MYFNPLLQGLYLRNHVNTHVLSLSRNLFDLRVAQIARRVGLLFAACGRKTEREIRPQSPRYFAAAVAVQW